MRLNFDKIKSANLNSSKKTIRLKVKSHLNYMEHADIVDNEEVRKLVDIVKEKYRIEYNSENCGFLCLKTSISVRELNQLSERNSFDEKFFSQKFVHEHLLDNKITFEEICKISDEELIDILAEILKSNNEIFNYHSNNTKELSFLSFKRAIEDYCYNINKELSEPFSSLNEDWKYQFQLLGGNFTRSVIQGIIDATAPLKEISASLSQTSVEFAPIYKQLSDISNINSQISTGIGLSMNNDINNIMSLSTYIEKYSLPIIQPFIQFQFNWINQFRNIFDGIQESLEKIRVTAEEADEILKKYKWLISPSLPLDFTSRVIKINNDITIPKTSKYHQINKEFVAYLSGDNYTNLQDIINSWDKNQLFKPRMKIFRDSLELLKKSQKRVNTNNFIIPTLIAQIDGIISEYLKLKGWDYAFNPKNNRLNWVDTTGTNTNRYSSQIQCYKDIYSGDYQLFASPNFLLLEILFQSAYHGQELNHPFTFSRHKIMHGEYLNYGRTHNTLRSFLILDFLAELK